VEVKNFSDVTFTNAAAGEFVARIATLNVPDRNGDVLLPGAFRDSLARWQAKGLRIPVIFAHAHRSPDAYVGEVAPENVRETDNAVVVHGRLYLDEAAGSKVFKSLQRKTLSEWSFAFIPTRAKKLSNGTREIAALDLLEVGPVLIGAGIDTATLSVKAADVRTALAGFRRSHEQLAAAEQDLARMRQRLWLARAEHDLVARATR
jgi:HK97 family phage prohead protease